MLLRDLYTYTNVKIKKNILFFPLKAAANIAYFILEGNLAQRSSYEYEFSKLTFEQRSTNECDRRPKVLE